jgi:hypothetical protein
VIDARGESRTLVLQPHDQIGLQQHKVNNHERQRRQVKCPLSWHSQAPEHVEGEEQKTSPSGLLTPVLAFAKPLSMSRGRARDMEKKRIELETQ